MAVETELAEAIRAIQQRVRARHPQGPLGLDAIELPDLTPLVHARDAVQGKVAAIGTVNPRPSGLVNNFAQALKRLVARALDWHVREQVEFNRAALEMAERTIEAFNEQNRTLMQAAAHFQAKWEEQHRRWDAVHVELDDLRAHSAQWRAEWDQRLTTSEIRLFENVAELLAAFQHRVGKVAADFRGALHTQHVEFEAVVEKSVRDLEGEFARVRMEMESVIHAELRVLRQRVSAPVERAPEGAPVSAAIVASPRIDWLRFADRFRGSEEYVKHNQERYVRWFEGCRPVLDIGCGRGEFLEVAKNAGIEAYGIDLSDECVALSRSKGLKADKIDLFEHLGSLATESLGGVFCAQVIEHLVPAEVPELIRLAAAKLKKGAPLVLETPNPECLAIFATHFYLDPTHTRPVPIPLVVFYLEEAGFGQIQVERLYPAVENLHSLALLPPEFREQFFGGLDYVVRGTRL